MYSYQTYDHSSPSDYDEMPQIDLSSVPRPPKVLETVIFNPDVPATPNSIYGRREARVSERSEYRRDSDDDNEETAAYNRITTPIYEVQQGRTPVGRREEPGRTPRRAETLKTILRSGSEKKGNGKKVRKETFISRLRKSSNSKYTEPVVRRSITRRKSNSIDGLTTEVERLVAVMHAHCKHCAALKADLVHAGLSQWVGAVNAYRRF